MCRIQSSKQVHSSCVNSVRRSRSCADFGGFLRLPNEDRDAPAGCGPLPMPERARNAVYGSEGVAPVQRIRRHHESSRVASVSMGQGLGLAGISEARASACVSIYSLMCITLPSRTVMSKTHSSLYGLDRKSTRLNSSHLGISY